MATTSFHRQRGQATVEHVGIVTAVALLMAALSLWVAANVRAPSAPPPLIEAATRPLGEAGAPGVVVSGAGIAAIRQMRGASVAPIGRFFRWTGRTLRDVVVGGPAVADGFVDRLRERGRALVDDPVGTIVDVVRDLTSESPSLVDLVRRQVGDVVDYATSLRGLSREEIIRRIGHDLGGTAADVAVSRATRAVVSRIRKARAGRSSKDAPPPRTTTGR